MRKAVELLGWVVLGLVTGFVLALVLPGRPSRSNPRRRRRKLSLRRDPLNRRDVCLPSWGVESSAPTSSSSESACGEKKATAAAAIASARVSRKRGCESLDASPGDSNSPLRYAP